MASMPVAAVTCGGSPTVSSGSSSATSGSSCAATTAALVVAPVVMMDMGVTSDPVPAVVGIWTSGSLAPVRLPIPYASASGWEELHKPAISFATSIELPPPRPITVPTFSARARASAFNTMSSGGSARTSWKMEHARPAAPRLLNAASCSPAATIPGSVTRKTLPEDKLAQISPSWPIAPGSQTIERAVLNLSGLMFPGVIVLLSLWRGPGRRRRRHPARRRAENRGMRTQNESR